jgi:hypothetical protein
MCRRATKVATAFGPVTWAADGHEGSGMSNFRKRENASSTRSTASLVVPAVLTCAMILASVTCHNALAQGSSQREAPVGHRQPTVSSVPQTQDQIPTDKKFEELDKAADKALKGICRGC